MPTDSATSRMLSGFQTDMVGYCFSLGGEVAADLGEMGLRKIGG